MAEKIEETKPASRRGEWQDRWKRNIPDYNTEDDEVAYGQQIDYLDRLDKDNESRRADNEKLAQALRSNPQLAQALSDVVSGKRGAGASLARYFGKDFLSAEEGSPEAEEIAQAEAERLAEIEEMAKRDSEYAENIEKSKAVWEEWGKSHNEDVEALLDNAFNKIIRPILNGEYTTEVMDALYKATNYDNDINDSMEAGIVKGRNENINKMRDRGGDGLPVVPTSTPPREKPKKVARNILSLAQEA